MEPVYSGCQFETGLWVGPIELDLFAEEESGQHGYKEGYPENPQLRKRSVAQEVRYCGGVYGAYMGFQYRTFKTCAFGRWPSLDSQACGVW